MEIYYGVKLDEQGYFTGMYMQSSSKELIEKNGIFVESLPNIDERYYKACRLINNEWILDEEKLKSIQENINKQESIEKKYFEIDELKKKLSDTDYNAIKCLEEIIKHFASILPLGDYKPIGDNRESWRARINALEEEIKEIEEAINGSNNYSNY